MDRGIEQAQQEGYKQLEAEGLMFRSYINFERGKSGEARKDLLSGLVLMKKNDLDTFWCWTPHIMQQLLCEAVAADIEPEFAGKLAGKRFRAFVTRGGEPCPYLEIHILGNFQFLLDHKVIAEAADFTPMQRSFLLIVLASPGCQLSQEKAQTLLWPDTPKEKARRTLDTLISRLRSMLRPLLPTTLFKSFLQVGQGMITLHNSVVDAFVFSRLLQQFENHAANEEWWQAGNCFASARELWKGCFGMDNLLDDIAYEYCRGLQARYFTAVDRWSAFLVTSGQYREAHSVLDLAFTNYPTLPLITVRLYHLHLREKNAVAAKLVLDQYRQRLVKQGLPNIEIEDLITAIAQ